MKLTREELVYLRFQKNGLIEPLATIEDCARVLVGVQVQIQQFAEVSIFNRTEDISIEAYQKNQLIKIWGQRGTVHTYALEDWDLIAAMYHGRLRWTAKYSTQQATEFKELLSEMDQFGIEKAKCQKKN